MRKRSRLGMALKLSGVLFVLVSAVGAIEAAQLVTFSHGQYLVVESAEQQGAWYYLILEGGGQMGVPAARVARIEEYEPPPGAPVASSAPMNRGIGAAPQAHMPAGRNVAPSSPGQPVVAGLPAGATGSNPAAAQPNVASQGRDDWRYKTKMSGGPKRQLPGLSGAGAAGARGGQQGKRPLPGARQNTPNQ